MPLVGAVPHSLRVGTGAVNGMVDRPPEDIVAPDGIIIRPIAGAGSALVSVVVGVIPPRADDYAVHVHYALEQVTYVLRGRITALWRGPSDLSVTESVLGPGEAITTPPATTLAFRNREAEPAEVLFICVPPYPASNADTEVIGEHRPLSPEEQRRVAERLLRAEGHLSGELNSRARALRWLSSAERD